MTHRCCFVITCSVKLSSSLDIKDTTFLNVFCHIYVSCLTVYDKAATQWPWKMVVRILILPLNKACLISGMGQMLLNKFPKYDTWTPSRPFIYHFHPLANEIISFLVFKLLPCSKCNLFLFWVIPRCLSSNCRCFGTHYRFHLHRQVTTLPDYRKPNSFPQKLATWIVSSEKP